MYTTKDLQRIGKEIVSSRIIFKDGYLEPIWIEAYYFYPEKYIDESMDAYKEYKKSGIRNTQFESDIIYKSNRSWNYARVDLCKGNKEFALSYLIKLALYVDNNGNKKVLPQSKIAGLFNDKDNVRLEKINDINCDYKKRIGLKGKSKADEPLAIVRMVNDKFYSYQTLRKHVDIKEWWNTLLK